MDAVYLVVFWCFCECLERTEHVDGRYAAGVVWQVSIDVLVYMKVEKVIGETHQRSN